MTHVEATDRLPPGEHPALIVWPEHAVPRYLDAEPMLAAQLARLATRRRADLLFGVPRFEGGRVYNSVQLITAAGRNGGHYDKQRLVLGAESNPLARSAAAGPDHAPSEFSAGTEPGVLRSFVPFGVSICHEILFPELATRAVREGAELLVNVSNDGWLDSGHGVASRQHFAMAVFRAVETRRYLVRAATTGVSGIVDPYGRVVDTLGPGASGVVVGSVAGRTGMTLYVRVGDAFAFACLLAAAAALHGRRAGVLRPHPRLAPASRLP
jgi:apolipoprotein N-acyltransferase